MDEMREISIWEQEEQHGEIILPLLEEVGLKVDPPEALGHPCGYGWVAKSPYLHIIPGKDAREVVEQTGLPFEQVKISLHCYTHPSTEYAPVFVYGYILQYNGQKYGVMNYATGTVATVISARPLKGAA